MATDSFHKVNFSSDLANRQTDRQSDRQTDRHKITESKPNRFKVSKIIFIVSVDWQKVKLID